MFDLNVYKLEPSPHEEKFIKPDYKSFDKKLKHPIYIPMNSDIIASLQSHQPSTKPSPRQIKTSDQK